MTTKVTIEKISNEITLLKEQLKSNFDNTLTQIINLQNELHGFHNIINNNNILRQQSLLPVDLSHNNLKKQNVTIILTSTVNVHNHKQFIYQRNKNDRLAIYLKSIKQWLEKTNFHIVLVENSDYPFTELSELLSLYKNRFEIITFNEKILNNKGLLTCDSKGVSEMYAINYAYNNSKLIQNSIFIIKVTARYFIPELEDYLSEFDLTKYDILTQYHKRCEMVGCNSNIFNIIFDQKTYSNGKSIYEPHVENVYHYRYTFYDRKIPPKLFKIEETQRGGDNIPFTNI